MTQSTWLAMLLLGQTFSFVAYGQVNEENKISFDFAKMSISTYGASSPNQNDKNSGLLAEVNARKLALTNIENYFKASCQKIEKKQIGTKPGWNNYFHSQGSEIYSNGVVKVTLAAAMRDIIKPPATSPNKFVYYVDKAQNEKVTEDKSDKNSPPKKKIAFSMMFSLPGNSVQCGAAILDVGVSNKKVMIFPTKVVSSAIGLTVVKLVYDGKSELKGATPDDINIIKNSSLAEEPYIPASIIPVTVVIPQ
ncbi:hypothetical protein [Silvanigrella aquatica]|uniref:Uncharacterized protein n=1 Tax=Silvanigrella aquatica TaxID=1915309 RepID=A0A1L4D3H2_9BACT|nr:hypothetical protein [Silvanigrella aquatica]APJ04744.1 hypothetical protein AXG55_12895 [Silvanigrella aquatica]